VKNVSYADALVLACSTPRTVIVGPPGTGKSQLADDVELLTGRRVLRTDDLMTTTPWREQAVTLLRTLSASEGNWIVEGCAMARVLAYWDCKPALVLVRDTVFRPLGERATVLEGHIRAQLERAYEKTKAEWMRVLPLTLEEQ